MGQTISDFFYAPETPPPSNTRLKKKPIDRKAIGKPADFKHTAHMGASDFKKGFDLDKIKDEMANVALALNLDVNSDSSSSKPSEPKKTSASDLNRSGSKLNKS